MDVSAKIDLIRRWYEQRDREQLDKGERPTHTTEFGIWGASGMLDCYELFSKLELERFSRFADYGSGDGRVVLIAALFTQATGIEGDEDLHKVALAAKEELIKTIPELKNASFKNKNYAEEDHSNYDMIFVFMDHPYPRAFEQALKDTFKGWLISYHEIHLPHSLKKGKTYWIQQLPIISYPINIEEEELFGRRSQQDPAFK